MSTYLIAWCLTMIPMMYSPGPTNMIVASAGVRGSFKSAIGLIFGINIGLGVQMLIISAGLTEFLDKYPITSIVMHYAGIAYMAYLAYKCYRAPISDTTAQSNSGKKLYSIIDGVLIEILNPKVWFALIAVSALFSKHITAIAGGFLIVTILTIALNFLNNILWFYFGVVIIRISGSNTSARTQNFLFGTILLLTAIYMI